MATTLIQTLALMLALTGFSATTYSGSGDGNAGTGVSANGVTGTPFPQCSPNDPNHCGLD